MGDDWSPKARQEKEAVSLRNFPLQERMMKLSLPTSRSHLIEFDKRMNRRESPSTNTLVFISALGSMFLCLMLAAGFIFVTLLASRRPESVPPTEQPIDGGKVKAENMLKALMGVEVPAADPIALAQRLGSAENVPTQIPERDEVLAVGTTESFWVTNTENNQTSEIEAALIYVSDHVYFWIDQRALFDESDVRRVVDTFDESTYSQTRAVMGSEWSPGIDGERRLHILYSHGLGPSVAGLFFSRDEYPSAVQPYSNQREMFYLSADNVSLGSDYVDSVLAHEFQHMVQWNLDRNEDTWLNEGLSELNELMLGYDPGGFDQLFARDPDIPLLQWPSEPGRSGEHYGQVFLFLTYLYDRFGTEAITKIAQDPANGLDSIEKALQDQSAGGADSEGLADIDRLFIEWGASLALQDPHLDDGRYGLSSYVRAPSATYSEEIEQCPHEESRSQVHQYGIDLMRIECEGDYNLHFSGDELTRVIATDPHSGDWMMWSNRGDDSNTTLSRAFDLRGLKDEIRLEYWTWYRIEEDYDYAYLEASTDAGDTWQILQAPSSVLENPSGNSYGWAYNGNSGGGPEPEWIREGVDLSEFGGEELILRFEYVTDSAVNGEGILIDDLELVGSGYETDFEDGSSGWETSGFVRLYNQIPQTFQLALILTGGETRVSLLEMPNSGMLDLPLDFSGTTREAILVVTGTSRFSWVPANYSIQIDSR